MIFFLPVIAEHTWLAPIAHFLSSAIIGTMAYFLSSLLLEQKRTRLAFAIFVGIATHIFFDFLGWF